MQAQTQKPNQFKTKTWKEPRKMVLRAKRPNGKVEALLVMYFPISGKTMILQKDVTDFTEPAMLGQRR